MSLDTAKLNALPLTQQTGCSTQKKKNETSKAEDVGAPSDGQQKRSAEQG